jgi:hypothetical protein
MWSRDYSPGGSMASLTVGQRLGAYEIIGPLGAGGMGEVFRARDSRLDPLLTSALVPVCRRGTSMNTGGGLSRTPRSFSDREVSRCVLTASDGR